MLTPGTKIPVVWITKYALIRGVGVYKLEDAVVQQDVDTIYVQYGYRDSFYRKNEWHLTEDEAKARVRAMVASRRKAMRLADERLQKILDTLDTNQWSVKQYTDP